MREGSRERSVDGLRQQSGSGGGLCRLLRHSLVAPRQASPERGSPDKEEIVTAVMDVRPGSRDKAMKERAAYFSPGFSMRLSQMRVCRSIDCWARRLSRPKHKSTWRLSN